MNIYLGVILAAIIVNWGLNEISRILDRRAMSPVLPREFEGWYDADKYRTSQAYGRDSQVLASVSQTFMAAVLVTAILSGAFNALDLWMRGWGWGPIPTGIAYLLLVGLAADMLNMPFEVYDTFVLEERYGFNRTTARLFVQDKLKGWLLGAILGVPLLGAILWIFEHAARWPWAWLAAWGIVSVVAIALAALGPTLIMPLFNRFTTLADGPLRQALEGYARAQGFTLSGIFVMDGSKRSAKGNAFFAGLGKAKRIALFDTLIDSHGEAEIVAVLAHEVGHYRLGHIRLMLVTGILKAGVMFFFMQQLLDSAGLFAAFGMQRQSVYAGVLFFALLYQPVSLLLELASAWLSRRNEYAADAFSARTTGHPEDLVAALKRLTVTNLGNLTPHPFTVVLHYSHPPVLERIKALRALLPQAATDDGPAAPR